MGPLGPWTPLGHDRMAASVLVLGAGAATGALGTQALCCRRGVQCEVPGSRPAVRAWCRAGETPYATTASWSSARGQSTQWEPEPCPTTEDRLSQPPEHAFPLLAAAAAA